MAQDQMRDECKDLFAELVQSQTKQSHTAAMMEIMLRNHMKHVADEISWMKKWSYFCALICSMIFGCVIALVVQ